jgi:hypothetical protein
MMKELLEIQSNLKAPKGQFNSFGKYRYRSAEDILEAVKPLLYKYDCMLFLSDEIVAVGNRIYVKATATITNAEGVQVQNTAFAREEEEKKGMDGSQITGTASSYARKYALNGLFLIDDTKDADTNEHHLQTQAKTQTKQKSTTIRDVIATLDPNDAFGLKTALEEIEKASTKDELLAVYNTHADLVNNPTFMNCLSAKKKTLC